MLRSQINQSLLCIQCMLCIHWKRVIHWMLFPFLLLGCTQMSSPPAPTPTATLPAADGDLTEDQIAALGSLEQVDSYPLYTMHYAGVYAEPVRASPASLASITPHPPEATGLAAPTAFQDAWGCSLFAALGDPENRLYGRNFDWRFSPAVLLFTDPPDGYASVSMVDIEYLGFEGDLSKNLTDLSIPERMGLLESPSLPFDGMNEKGLAIGMAAVDPGQMRSDPSKKTIEELAVIREILDHAATVDEAVDILASYNIDMGNIPLHYLIASADGASALVEFYQGEMVVIRNENPWQLATNFIVASTGGETGGICPRYDRIDQRLQESNGQLSAQEALGLLDDVSQGSPHAQSNTQWSIVYDLTGGEIYVVMGMNYVGGAHTLHLDLSGQ